MDLQNKLLRKGQICQATVESIAPGGEGMTRELAVPVFVNRAAPGDKVELEIFDVRKGFARARILRVLEPSQQRQDPPCKLFKICGGCQWQHMAYQWQLKAKEDLLRQSLRHIGGFTWDADVVLPTIGAQQPFHYRNKVQFPVAQPKGSTRILAGYYKQDSHDLVNIKHCPVQPEPLDRLIEIIKELAESYGLSAYEEVSRKGLLRHINARYSFATGKVLVTLVVNAIPPNGIGEVGKLGRIQCAPTKLLHGNKKLLSMYEGIDSIAMQEFAEQIMSRVPEVSGVCLNFNPHAGNRILGEVTQTLAGEPYVVERLATARKDLPEQLQRGLEFRLSSTSFFQVNTAQAVRLLEHIVDAVALPVRLDQGKIPLIVDAYAGVGTIALWLSSIAAQVIAIEEHRAAVSDGLLNLQVNGIDNVDFKLGKVESVLAELKLQKIVPDLIILDPPRKGLSQEVMECVIDMGIPAIVYVSCNPATLARDLKFLCRSGYKTKQVQPIDMFPQTYHVESVTLLEQS